MGLSLCSKASSPSNMLQAQLSITPLTLELPGTMPISRTCAPTLKHCQSFVPLVMLNGSRRSKWTQGPAQSPTLSGGLTLPFFPQFHIEDSSHGCVPLPRGFWFRIITIESEVRHTPPVMYNIWDA